MPLHENTRFPAAAPLIDGGLPTTEADSDWSSDDSNDDVDIFWKPDSADQTHLSPMRRSYATDALHCLLQMFFAMTCILEHAMRKAITRIYTTMSALAGADCVVYSLPEDYRETRRKAEGATCSGQQPQHSGLLLVGERAQCTCQTSTPTIDDECIEYSEDVRGKQTVFQLNQRGNWERVTRYLLIRQLNDEEHAYWVYESDVDDDLIEDYEHFELLSA